MFGKRKVEVEYEYTETETGNFGTDYVSGESIEEVQRKLLERSRGGDVEVIRPRKVRD